MQSKKFFYPFISFPSSLRYPFTLSLLITIPTLWYFFIYLPVERKITYYQTQGAVLHKQKQSLGQLDKQVKQLAHKQSMMHKQYTLFCTQSQDVQNTGGLLPFVNKAQDAGLRVESCTRSRQQCTELSTQQPVTLAFSGSLEDVQMFLNNLTSTNTFCSCMQLQVQKREDDQFQVTCSLLSCCFFEAR